MKKILTTLSLAVLVTACSVDPQAAAERRQALIQEIFPNPADQQGLRLVFPIESFGFAANLEIIYYPDEVSQSTVMKRASGHCSKYKSRNNVSGQAKLNKEPVTKTITLADGSSKRATQIFLTCITS